MNLKLLGRIIQAIFLATVYLGGKMSPIVICNATLQERYVRIQIYGVHMAAKIYAPSFVIFAATNLSRAHVSLNI